MKAKAEAKILVKISGSVSVSMHSMDVHLSFRPGTYQSGSSLGPQVDVTRAEIGVSSHNVKIKVGGKIASKFTKPIVDIFKSKIVKSAVSAGNKAAKSAANEQVNKMLRSFPLTADLPSTPLFIDYSLGAAPQVKSDHVELYINGSILNKASPQRPPFTPSPFTAYNPSWRHMQFYFSPYVFNSALWSLYTAGFFNYLVKSESVPSGAPVKLDTTTFGEIIPLFKELYGEGKPIDLQCSAHKQPEIQMTTSDLSGMVGGQCTFQVRLDDGTKDDALTIKTESVAFSISADVQPPRVFGHFNSIHMSNFETIFTKVGDVDLMLFSELINQIANVSIPVLNEFIKDGFKLPTVEGIQLTESEIHNDPAFLEVGNSPVYVGLYEFLMEE